MSSVTESGDVFKVTADIGHMALSLLGTQVKCKFIVDGHHSQPCNCVCDLLQCIDLQNPVGHILLSAVDAHHRQFRCGTKTLLAITVLMMEAAESLITKGIEADAIIRGFHQGIQVCMENLQYIEFEKLYSKSQDSTRFTEEGTPVMQPAGSVADCEEFNDDISWNFDKFTEYEDIDKQTLKLSDQKISFDKISPKNVNQCYSSLKDTSEGGFDEFEASFSETLAVFNDCKRKSTGIQNPTDFKSSHSTNEILKQTLPSRVSAPSSLKLNRSRHFRTVETAVQEFSHKEHMYDTCIEQQLCQTYGFQTQNLTLRHNLQNIVQSKSSSSHQKTLNRSRHTGSVKSMIAEHEADSSHGRMMAKQAEATAENTAQESVDSGDNSTSHMFHVKSAALGAWRDQFLWEFKSQTAATQSPDVDKSLMRIIEGTCHNLPNLVPVIAELFLQQNRNTDILRFEIDKIHTCLLSYASPVKCQAVQGFIMKTTADMLALLTQQHDLSHNALFVNGDLTMSFKHTGYKATLGGKVYAKEVHGTSAEGKWNEDVLQLLIKYEVSVLFIRGHAHPDLELACQGHSIMIIQNVPIRMLQAMSAETGADMLIYVQECTVDNIAAGVVVSPWKSDWMDSASQQYLIVRSAKQDSLTALLCSWNNGLVSMMEESFWHAINRLHNIVNTKIVLPGSGCTELLCHNLLKKYSGDVDNIEKEIINALADVFCKYLATVCINNGRDTNSMGTVAAFKGDTCLCIDDCLSKTKAWTGSIYVLKQLLNIDLEIYTSTPL